MSKNLFIVEFGVRLWLLRWGVTGFWANLAAIPLRILVGSFIDTGIYVIDLSIASVKIALKEDKYREAALAAYKRATAKVYSEAEKDEIRLEYLRILSEFVTIGSGVLAQQATSKRYDI